MLFHAGIPAAGAEPTSIKSHPRYFVKRRTAALRKTGIHGIWYDICMQRTVARRDRAGWKKPLGLTPHANPRLPGRRDLAVQLWSGVRGKKHTFYHRVVALSLLKCHWNARGELLQHPFKVPLRLWEADSKGRYYYEVHHLQGPHNVDPRALAVLPRRLHEKVTKEGFTLPPPAGDWGC